MERGHTPAAQRSARLPAQCLVCFLRAAAGNVSGGPWLGEAGCPGFLRSSLARRSVFSVLHFLSQGASETHSPLRLFGPSVPLPFRKSSVGRLMCGQHGLWEAGGRFPPHPHQIHENSFHSRTFPPLSPAFMHHESARRAL